MKPHAGWQRESVLEGVIVSLAIPPASPGTGTVYHELPAGYAVSARVGTLCARGSRERPDANR